MDNVQSYQNGTRKVKLSTSLNRVWLTLHFEFHFFNVEKYSQSRVPTVELSSGIKYGEGLAKLYVDGPVAVKCLEELAYVCDFNIIINILFILIII